MHFSSDKKQNCRAIVIGNRPLSGGYYALELEAPQIARLAKPGQFVLLATAELGNEGREPFLRRPFAISYIGESRGMIRIIYRLKGRGTYLLSQLQLEQSVQLTGPLGHGWDIDGDIHQALLVGGGRGQASLLPLARELAHRGVTVDMLMGAVSADGLLCSDEFADCGYLRLATEDGSKGESGRVSKLLPELPAYDIIYTAGPPEMMRAVCDWAERVFVRCQVSLESRMGCGIGACQCCAAESKGGEQKYVRVCSCGPVFDSSEVKF